MYVVHYIYNCVNLYIRALETERKASL
jgi:hypothetical protein